MINNVLIIIVSILLSSLAHIFLKKGMMEHALTGIKPDGIADLIWVIGTNPWVLGGMSLHVSALVVWLWALSRVDISFAYPFLALGYVLVGTMAWLWLGEELSSMRGVGMAIIIIGIFVLAKTG